MLSGEFVAESEAARVFRPAWLTEVCRRRCDAVVWADDERHAVESLCVVAESAARYSGAPGADAAAGGVDVLVVDNAVQASLVERMTAWDEGLRPAVMPRGARPEGGAPARAEAAVTTVWSWSVVSDGRQGQVLANRVLVLGSCVWRRALAHPEELRVLRGLVQRAASSVSVLHPEQLARMLVEQVSDPASVWGDVPTVRLRDVGHLDRGEVTGTIPVSAGRGRDGRKRDGRERDGRRSARAPVSVPARAGVTVADAWTRGGPAAVEARRFDLAAVETSTVETSTVETNLVDLTTVEALCFERLRAWRFERAKTLGVPAYRVATNRVLRSVCRALPRDREALAQLPGVGHHLLDAHGDALIAVLHDEPWPRR